jgi:hypothetical protein
VHVTNTTPLRLIILQFLHLGLTLACTFIMFPFHVGLIFAGAVVGLHAAPDNAK